MSAKMISILRATYIPQNMIECPEESLGDCAIRNRHAHKLETMLDL